MDFRVLGQHARQRTQRAYDHFPIVANLPGVWTSVNDGDLVLCTRGPADGLGTTCRWWMDPQRGWNVVRCGELRDGQMRYRVVFTLERQGEHWFPKTVDYEAADGTIPFSVRVRAARLDDPTLPARLDPAFIEVEPGTNVHHLKPDGSWDAVAFDGQRVVSEDEFQRRRRAGELKLGPAFEAGLARLREQNARRDEKRRYMPGEWELYVEGFISRHDLSEPQKDRAWEIYQKCRMRADTYLAAKEAEIRTLEAQNAAENKSESKPAGPDADKRLRLLRAPVREILDSELVPGLGRLLTPAQCQSSGDPDFRAAPGSQPTRLTAPADM